MSPTMHTLICCLAVITMLNLASGPAQAQENKRPELVVPKLAEPPKIDGKMDPGEWDKATAMTGFMGATGSYGKVIVPKASRIYMAHDGERFYLGVWMQLAPGEKPTMRYRRRDSKIYMDRQQFEFWLTPPTEGQTTAYQTIGNAYGAVYDIQHVPQLGVKNPGWNGNWEFKNDYKVGQYWTAELSIPFDDLVDPDNYNPDKPWGGMVAVAWPQRSWPFTFGWYSNIDTHALMTMADNGTCARVMDMSGLLDGKLAPVLELVNDEDKPAEFKITAGSGAEEHVQTVTVPAGQTRQITFTKQLTQTDKKVNPAALTVTGPDGKALVDGQWFFRPMEVAERQEAVAAQDDVWKMSTRVDYAPLAMGVHAWADVLDYPKRDQLDKVRFTVRHAGAEAEPVKQVEVTEYKFDAADTYIWLPDDLAEGTYQVVTEFLAADQQVLDRASNDFAHKDYTKEFAWLGSDKYGEDIKVAPPFEPLKTAGKTFSVWGREYQMNGALPEQLTSQGEKMLAGPVTFVAVVDGKPVKAEIAEPFKLVKADQSFATFTGRYRVAGTVIELSGEMAFDGAIIYDFKATPQTLGVPAEIERLYLSVPVRKQVADYMWTTRGGMNGISRLLENLPRTGVIWDSAELADFTPYLGLADDDRAIQWFADDDHEWVLGEDVPCTQLVGDGQTVEMQINLVRAKTRGAKFSGRFGLITTPVKPLPSGWRNTVLDNRRHAGSTVNFFYGPGHGKVGPVEWHDTAGLAKANGIKIPKGKNPEFVLDRMSGEGYPDLEAIARNLGEGEAKKVAGGLKTYEDQTLTKVCYFHNAQMYFEGNKSKAFKTFFRGDWSLTPPSGWFHLRPVESYQDFFCYHLDQFAKFWHVPGLYFDEVYFGPDYNVFNGQGKIMPDGEIRPSVALMLQRRLLMRTRQVLLDNGITPFQWVHTSEIMAPFAISAADIAMFGEPNIPTPQTDIIDSIRPVYMRTLGRTDKFGFISVWMTMAGRGGPNWDLAGRQTYGWCWVHDTVPEVHTTVRGEPLVHYRADWGIAEDDVKFTGYWQDSNAAKTNDEDFIVSYWTRPHPDGGKKVLMMVMNLHYRGENATGAKITIDPEALGLPDGWKAYDLRTQPLYQKREQAMRELDEKTSYRAKDLEGPGPDELLGRAVARWDTGNADVKAASDLDVSELKVVSDRKKTFELTIPGRDFATIIIE